jgi:hypothetical protein
VYWHSVPLAIVQLATLFHALLMGTLPEHLVWAAPDRSAVQALTYDQAVQVLPESDEVLWGTWHWVLLEPDESGVQEAVFDQAVQVLPLLLEVRT